MITLHGSHLEPPCWAEFLRGFCDSLERFEEGLCPLKSVDRALAQSTAVLPCSSFSLGQEWRWISHLPGEKGVLN